MEEFEDTVDKVAEKVVQHRNAQKTSRIAATSAWISLFSFSSSIILSNKLVNTRLLGVIVAPISLVFCIGFLLISSVLHAYKYLKILSDETGVKRVLNKIKVHLDQRNLTHKWEKKGFWKYIDIVAKPIDECAMKIGQFLAKEEWFQSILGFN